MSISMHLTTAIAANMCITTMYLFCGLAIIHFRFMKPLQILQHSIMYKLIANASFLPIYYEMKVELKKVFSTVLLPKFEFSMSGFIYDTHYYRNILPF